MQQEKPNRKIRNPKKRKKEKNIKVTYVYDFSDVSWASEDEIRWSSWFTTMRQAIQSVGSTQTDRFNKKIKQVIIEDIKYVNRKTK